MDMRQTNQVASFFTCAALVLSAGCGRPQQRQTIEQICLADTTKAQAMQAAEDVLGRMHFVIEKADPKHGFIKTRPLPGAQSFEFWRSDNVGARNSLMANVHTIRRTVELDLSKPQGRQLCISCNVKVQQMSMPEYQISSGSQAYTMFSVSASNRQTFELHREQAEYLAWLDKPNDALLATLILERIEQRLAKTGSGPVSPTTPKSTAPGKQK
jgi:hypothetical protein